VAVWACARAQPDSPRADGPRGVPWKGPVDGHPSHPHERQEGDLHLRVVRVGQAPQEGTAGVPRLLVKRVGTQWDGSNWESVTEVSGYEEDLSMGIGCSNPQPFWGGGWTPPEVDRYKRLLFSRT